MSLFQIYPDRPSLRTRVSARTREVDRYRRQRISTARLFVYENMTTDRVANFYADIKGLPFQDSGETPFYWQFFPSTDRNIRNVLRILLARGAYVPNIGDVKSRAQRAFPIPSSDGIYRPLALEIIRVERTRLGRGLGEPVEMLGPSTGSLPWTTLARSILGSEDSQAFQFPSVDQRPGIPRVSHLPDGLLIEKSAHGNFPAWQIRVTTPLDQPAAFAYNLFGPTAPPEGREAIPDFDRDHLSRTGHFYTLRIVKTENVDIDVHVELPNSSVSIDFRIEYHVITRESGRREGDPELDTSALGPASDEATSRWNHIALVPPQGSYLNPRHFQFYTLTHGNRDGVPPLFRTWSVQSLFDRQVVGDPISIRARRHGNRTGPVAPRISSSFTPQLQAAITITELAIGMIPIVGTIYDVGSILYLRATGRSFWGERREVGLMDLVGIAGIGLGIVDDAVRAGRGMRRAMNLYDRAVSNASPIDNVLRYVDPPVRSQLSPPPATRPRSRPRLHDTSGIRPEAFTTRGQEVLRQAAQRARRISRRTEREVLRLLEELDEQNVGIVIDVLVDAPGPVRRAVLSATTQQATARALLDLDEELLGKILTNHERYRLLRVMTPDFRQFSNELLASGYRAHISKRLAKGQRRITPLTWIRRQRTGVYHEELVRLLGRGYSRRMARAQALGTTSELDHSALQIFQSLRQDIVSYSELVARRNAANTSTLEMGRFFDADHLFEKRFIFHLQESLPHFDTDSLKALLVPKDQRTMALLRDLSSDPLRTYDHVTKTQLMRCIIPYGEQHLFNLQQWWDAHVWVYWQLEVPDFDDVINALESDFQRISSELGESFEPRRRIDNLNLLPSNQTEIAGHFRQ